MPSVRTIPFLEGRVFGMLPTRPCSFDFEKHDWAYLEFNEVIVLCRCQACGWTPVDVMSAWRLQEWPLDKKKEIPS